MIVNVYIVTTSSFYGLLTLFVLYILHMNTLIVAALEAKSVGDNGEMEDLDSTPNNYYSL